MLIVRPPPLISRTCRETLQHTPSGLQIHHIGHKSLAFVCREYSLDYGKTIAPISLNIHHTANYSLSSLAKKLR
jgi:hypothetical protein